jgi:hypothetical protein
MKLREIEKYLAELGKELDRQGIKKPIRILMIGGAYMMLLAKAPRTTDDIDIFWLEEGEEFQRSFPTLRDSVHTIAEKYELAPNWFNYLTQMLIYDQIVIPKGKLWKRYGPLHIYAPPKEYILALKILAGRDKDIADCVILLPQTKIKTRQQAQQLLDRYILPTARENNADQIEDSLNKLFEKQ